MAGEKRTATLNEINEALAFRDLRSHRIYRKFKYNGHPEIIGYKIDKFKYTVKQPVFDIEEIKDFYRLIGAITQIPPSGHITMIEVCKRWEMTQDHFVKLMKKHEDFPSAINHGRTFNSSTRYLIYKLSDIDEWHKTKKSEGLIVEKTSKAKQALKMNLKNDNEKSNTDSENFNSLAVSFLTRPCSARPRAIGGGSIIRREHTCYEDWI